jgi:uncharacterized membrane protein YdjX (TVP38/TMEM64 family)
MTVLVDGGINGLAIVLLVAGGASATGMPGVIIPLTVLAAATLGPLPATVAVLAGVVGGSQLLFWLMQHVGRDRIIAKFGDRIAIIERGFTTRGLMCLVGLRLIGTPHLLVTGASAILPVRHVHFATMTAVGTLPAICLSAGATLIF